MKSLLGLRTLALGLAVVPGALALALTGRADPREPSAPAAPAAPAVRAAADGADQVVAMRRMTESQYRNAIADIFGPGIKVAGRFEPMIRSAHHLISTAAGQATISPTGLEQFDGIARNIASQVFDEAHRANFVDCTPRDAKAADSDCARQTLSTIGRYLFRRPLTTGEQAGFVKIADDGANQTSSFYDGMKLSLAAMMVSPSFLYIVERAEPDPDHPGALRLDNYSRAARLSFTLWDTTPNDALLQAAAAGRLTDQAQLGRIAAAMVKSQRLEAGIRAFFSDMLMFERFDDLNKDSVVYPRFNADVAAAMPEQILRTVVDLLVTRDSDYRELFTTRRTFMTRALGPLYGARVDKMEGWFPYEFGPGDERAGILTQAGMLALGDAQVGRSSPTIRGRAIRELLLCQPVPDPPGNVSFTAVQETSSKTMPTAKARLGSHISNPVCAGCHRIIDPVGLTLERFDGIGAHRSSENGAPIDSSNSFDGNMVTGAADLGAKIAAGTSATECVAGRALEFVTGRASDDDQKLLPAIEKAFQGAEYRIPALFLRIATTPEVYSFPAAQGVKPAKTASLSTALKTSIGARR